MMASQFYVIQFNPYDEGVAPYYWNGAGWTPSIEEATVFAGDNLPEDIPSFKEGYTLFLGKRGGYGGEYVPPEEYWEELSERDPREFLADGYGSSLYWAIRIKAEECRVSPLLPPISPLLSPKTSGEHGEFPDEDFVEEL